VSTTPGDVPCPAQFTQKHLINDPSKTTDTRACEGTCSCGAAGGGSCSATITIYSAGTVDTCSGLIATLNPTTAAGDCQPISGDPPVGSREAVYGAVTPGTCPGSGGTATGSAAAAGATTVCCIPSP
jgi:hypothetical protein